MPFRAFDDSDELQWLANSNSNSSVLMPFRAFDDSDSHTSIVMGYCGNGLNALPGIR